MPYYLRCLCFFLVVLVASNADAHICDNIWRQADKLIIKPEVTDLVVKDKASFNIYLQSNMDRDIAKNLRLVGRSKAFDVQVEPQQGHRIFPGKPYEYNVSLTLKRGVSSGEYPIHFDAIVGDRTLRSYTMESVRRESRTRTRQTQTAMKVPVVSGAVPVIDGSLQDLCWKRAPRLRPKSNTDAVTPRLKSVALITGDEHNIYVCTGAVGGRESDGGQSRDSVLLLLAPPGSDDIYKFKVTADDGIAVVITRKGRDLVLDAQELGVTYATKCSKKVWNAELRVPLAAVGAVGKLENEIWRINIVRENTQGRGETSFWTGTPQNYSTLEGLREIVFSR